MYFWVKSILKNNYNYTFNHAHEKENDRRSKMLWQYIKPRRNTTWICRPDRPGHHLKKICAGFLRLWVLEVIIGQ